MSDPGVTPSTKSRADRLWWIDGIKGLAIAWIFVNHLVESFFGGPYMGWPTADWPPLRERLIQLLPLHGYGLWDWPLNALRYLGWTGDQGVQLFLIASGLGLTWSLLRRQPDRPLALKDFYWRRLARIYPLWWGAHLLFVVPAYLAGKGLRPDSVAFWLSMLGVPGASGELYRFSPAWWFIGLIIQLYLVYPLLWEGLRRFGPLRFLLLACVIGFAARLIGLLAFEDWVSHWSRGTIFVTRLPEFVLGMSLAVWLRESPDAAIARWRAPRWLAGAALVYAGGLALSFTLIGMTVAPFLLGAGAFAILVAVLSSIRAERSRLAFGLTWLGVHSYAIYLVHHPIILQLGPGNPVAGRIGFSLAASLGLIVVTLFVAIVLERVVDRATAIVSNGWARGGLAKPALALTAFGAAMVLLLLGAELAVRRFAPQEEANGWAERASLEPHPTFGWRLKPNSRTHMRWHSYDYTLEANALGFPGPLYPEEKPGNAFRIMTLGDAFESAEGVDTNQSWPRVLEKTLQEREPSSQIQVLNFAITGYGPNQNAAVLDAYAPRFRPDVILVGFFVNEYFDVLRSNEEFQESIGFGQPPQDGLGAVVHLLHLRRFFVVSIREPLGEIIRARPRGYGYFLGNFRALERDRSEVIGEGRQRVAERLARMKQTADSIGAALVLAMVPAPVQICGPGQLAYYPRHVDLNDAAKFDLDQPQRVTREIAESLGLACIDLRPALRDCKEGSPYQAHNMHFTAAGHRAVADFLAERLAETYLRSSDKTKDLTRPTRPTRPTSPTAFEQKSEKPTQRTILQSGL